MRRSRSPVVRHRSLWFRLTGWPRYALACLCAVLAVASFVAHPRSSAAHGATTTVVVVATRPLAAGALVGAGDVAARAFPSALAPSGLVAMAAVVGHRVSSALGPGEPVTTTRLLDGRLTDQLTVGQVAVTVRLADPAQVRGVQAGSRVDLYPAGSSPTAAAGVAARGPTAEAVRVLAVTDASTTESARPDAGSDSYSDPALVIACSRQIATAIAYAASTTFLATLLPPS